MLLIHGGFVDGSGWERVFTRLRKDGYSVSVVQNPTTSLVDDLAATRRAIEVSGGPVILVGHSYGGPVITQAGNDPRVVGLVAWKTKPSWYLIATDDHMIPPTRSGSWPSVPVRRSSKRRGAMRSMCLARSRSRS